MAGSSSNKAPRLAERLALVRRQRFVGRTAELEIFRTAMAASEAPFAVLYLYGPGGVGKTTLLYEFAHLAQEYGRSSIFLDGRNLDPSPAGFLLALQLALNPAENESALDTLARQPGIVLLVDTCETLAPLDGWLRHTFLPQLPEQALVVLAGRNLPSSDWRTDSGWGALTRIISLRNLRPEESRLFLTARGVPAEQQTAVLNFTYGYPLALSLVADVLSQSGSQLTFDLRSDPDVVRVLLECFVRDVSQPVFRQALQICAHARTTTEGLLTSILGETDAYPAFNWLRGLSFIEQGPYGLFPHDLVREVLEADLRWRNPERFREMHLQARRYLIDNAIRTTGLEQQYFLYAITFLHRNHPMMKPFFEWQSFGQLYTEPAGPADVPFIEAMVRKFQGEKAVEITRYWLQRQPQHTYVFRGADRQIAGFGQYVELNRLALEDIAVDPAVQTVADYIQRFGPIRPGEVIHHFRNWMGQDDYQHSLSIHNMAAMLTLRAIFTAPRLAWTFIAAADPDFYDPMFTHIRMPRLREADFELDGRHFGVFGHDWRVEPVTAWLEIMGEREIAADMAATEKAPMVTPMMVLSEPEFAEAVRQALRDYDRSDSLAHNPLLRSRLLRARTDDNPTPAALQTMLREAAGALSASVKDQKLYHALWYTYFEPAPTQERAAELLNLAIGLTRPTLEAEVRARLLARPNVRVIGGCDVLGLLAASENNRVEGVRLIRRRAGSAEETMNADLVVDAGGRGSRSPAWLEALGYDRPPEEVVRVDLGYASCQYRRRPDHIPGINALIVVATPPNRRSGVLVGQEGDRWMVTLGGYLGDHVPPGQQGLSEYARGLPTPEIYEVIKDAEPLGEPVYYKIPSNLRRRYEKLARFPQGYLVMGDALCSFNPIYGQGMTVAALEAVALGKCLAAGPHGLARRFFRKTSQIIDVPWQTAVGNDLRFAEIEGPRTPMTRFINWYLDRLHLAARSDPAVSVAFLKVINMLAAPPSLLQPDIIRRVVWGNLRGSKDYRETDVTQEIVFASLAMKSDRCWSGQTSGNDGRQSNHTHNHGWNGERCGVSRGEARVRRGGG